jgi:hypothetical protein
LKNTSTLNPNHPKSKALTTYIYTWYDMTHFCPYSRSKPTLMDLSYSLTLIFFLSQSDFISLSKLCAKISKRS